LPGGKSPSNYAPLSPGLGWPARCCYRDQRSEFIVDPRARLELQNVGGPKAASGTDAGEGVIGEEENLKVGGTELGIKVLEETGMAKQRTR